MKRGRIAVKVERGLFSTERSISFRGAGQTYHLLVDETALRDDKLKVGILDEFDDSFVVALPNETFTTNNIIRVPRELIEIG